MRREIKETEGKEGGFDLGKEDKAALLLSMLSFIQTVRIDFYQVSVSNLLHRTGEATQIVWEHGITSFKYCFAS